jgi:hypothetical protein
MDYFGLIFLAVILEGIITYVKEFFVRGNVKWEMLISIVIGVLVASAYGVDVLAMAGLKTAVPYLGSVLTGVLISRGSNYVFDLIKAVGAAQSKTSV